MHNFYTKMNEAMKTLNDTVDDTKVYKDQMMALNKTLLHWIQFTATYWNAFVVKQ